MKWDNQKEIITRDEFLVITLLSIVFGLGFWLLVTDVKDIITQLAVAGAIEISLAGLFSITIETVIKAIRREAKYLPDTPSKTEAKK